MIFIFIFIRSSVCLLWYGEVRFPNSLCFSTAYPLLFSISTSTVDDPSVLKPRRVLEREERRRKPPPPPPPPKHLSINLKTTHRTSLHLPLSPDFPVLIPGQLSRSLSLSPLNTGRKNRIFWDLGWFQSPNPFGFAILEFVLQFELIEWENILFDQRFGGLIG